MSSKFSTCGKWLRGRPFTTEALRHGEPHSQNRIAGGRVADGLHPTDPNRLKQVNSTFISPCLRGEVPTNQGRSPSERFVPRKIPPEFGRRTRRRHRRRKDARFRFSHSVFARIQPLRSRDGGQNKPWERGKKA